MTKAKQSPVRIAKSVKGLRERVERWRAKGKSIILVPTMGALHEGHLSLVRIARRKADKVVVSIFVNPAQFAPHEDFQEYPRELERDTQKLARENVDLIYAPASRIMYGKSASTKVQVEGLSDQLCGISRPHFFGGVATIVAKLLIQCAPDMAIFGEKDYQQLLVIRRMVRDLSLPVKILAGPVIRDKNGLALSSRNAYLSPEQASIAPMLNQLMLKAAQEVENGADLAHILEKTKSDLLKQGFDKIDYLEIHDAKTLDPVTGQIKSPARLFAAAYLGETRLIDNIELVN